MDTVVTKRRWVETSASLQICKNKPGTSGVQPWYHLPFCNLEDRNMKIKGTILTAVGIAALAAGIPTAASASGSVTLSIGSGYGDPYYGSDRYSDYNGYADYGSQYDDDTGYYRGGYNDGAYDGPGDYDNGYSTDVYVTRPYNSRQTYSYPSRRYRGSQRCTSGTTGAILGAVVGGLLGGEIGRGGYYDERSTTGTIVGAGGGALVGREIERSGCR
jgi:hypothetical protein